MALFARLEHPLVLLYVSYSWRRIYPGGIDRVSCASEKAYRSGPFLQISQHAFGGADMLFGIGSQRHARFYVAETQKAFGY